MNLKRSGGRRKLEDFADMMHRSGVFTYEAAVFWTRYCAEYSDRGYTNG
jgi:hypothetical protein